MPQQNKESHSYSAFFGYFTVHCFLKPLGEHSSGPSTPPNPPFFTTPKAIPFPASFSIVVVVAGRANSPPKGFSAPEIREKERQAEKKSPHFGATVRQADLPVYGPLTPFQNIITLNVYIPTYMLSVTSYCNLESFKCFSMYPHILRLRLFRKCFAVDPFLLLLLSQVSFTSSYEGPSPNRAPPQSATSCQERGATHNFPFPDEPKMRLIRVRI